MLPFSHVNVDEVDENQGEIKTMATMQVERVTWNSKLILCYKSTMTIVRGINWLFFKVTRVVHDLARFGPVRAPLI